MARHDPHGKEDLGERFSQFASVCGITDGHDLRSANDTPALNALKALRGAPISMGRGEIPVGSCQPPSGFAIIYSEIITTYNFTILGGISMTDKIGLTIEEAADYTGIGRNTMRKLVEWEKIPVLRIGRRYIIRIDVIHKFMEANQGADLLVREQVRAVR